MASQIIEIHNWKKYNPRSDISNPSWLRFQNNFFEDPDFYDFEPNERLFWIYILCCASKKNGVFSVSFEHCRKIGGFSDETIQSTIERLVNLSIISVTSQPRNVHVTPTLRPRTYNNERNERNERDETAELSVVSNSVGGGGLPPPPPIENISKLLGVPKMFQGLVTPKELRELFKDLPPDFVDSEYEMMRNYYDPKGIGINHTKAKKWFSGDWCQSRLKKYKSKLEPKSDGLIDWFSKIQEAKKSGDQEALRKALNNE